MDDDAVGARHVFVTGRVQGVAFRWATRAQATALGLTGWVRNLADGRVEVLIEGAEDPLASMLTWLADGPSQARVTDLDVAEEPPGGTAVGFEIRPTDA